MESIESVRVQNAASFHSLVETIRDLGTDNLSHFKNGYRKEGGYSLQQNPFELAALMSYLSSWIIKEQAAGRTADHYFEIGTASGGVMRLFVETLHFGNVTLIDDGGHHRAPERHTHVGAIMDLGTHVQECIADSHAPPAKSFLEHLRLGRRPPFDVAFIDGDHSYGGVMQDIDLTLPFVRPGGLVLFHDIIACAGDVGRAWQETVTRGRLRPVAEFIGTEVPLGIAVGEAP